MVMPVISFYHCQLSHTTMFSFNPAQFHSCFHIILSFQHLKRRQCLPTAAPAPQPPPKAAVAPVPYGGRRHLLADAAPLLGPQPAAEAPRAEFLQCGGEIESPFHAKNEADNSGDGTKRQGVRGKHQQTRRWADSKLPTSQGQIK